MVKFILSLIVLSMVSGCASRSVTPDIKEIKVSRKSPSMECKKISPVTGTSLSAKAGPEEALEDMKATAAAKGANYLLVKQYSETGTAVTGVAYECP